MKANSLSKTLIPLLWLGAFGDPLGACAQTVTAAPQAPVGARTLQQWAPNFSEIVVGSPVNDDYDGVTLFGKVYSYEAICAVDGLILNESWSSTDRHQANIVGGGRYLFVPDTVTVDPNNPAKVSSSGCPEHVEQRRLFSGDLFRSQAGVEAAALVIALAKGESRLRFKLLSQDRMIERGGERAAVAALSLQDVSAVADVTTNGADIYRVDFKKASGEHWVLTVTSKVSDLSQLQLVEIAYVEDAMT